MVQHTDHLSLLDAAAAVAAASIRPRGAPSHPGPAFLLGMTKAAAGLARNGVPWVVSTQAYNFINMVTEGPRLGFLQVAELLGPCRAEISTGR